MASVLELMLHDQRSDLAANITTTGATTLTVGSGQGAVYAGATAAAPIPIRIDNEVMWVTGRSTDTLTIVRAKEGTTAATHTAGTNNIEVVWTAGAWATARTLILALEALVLTNQSANTALRGPSSGAAALPAFRADVLADLPANIANAHISASADIALTKLNQGALTESRNPATYTPTTLLGQLDAIVSQIKLGFGGANWFTAPVATIVSLFAKFHASTGHVHTATGSDAPKVTHSNLATIGTDDHHGKSHVHLSDGSGTVAHSSLGSVSADQHHAQVHAISGGDHSGTIALSQLPAITQTGQSAATADQQTTSTSYADVTGDTSSKNKVVLTTSGGNLVVLWWGAIGINATGSRFTLRTLIDGNAPVIDGARPVSVAAGEYFSYAFGGLYTGVSAASHTVQVQWISTDGAQLTMPYGLLLVIELKK